MKTQSDSIIFLKGENEYTAKVLGCEKEYIWILVTDLKTVYVGHPNKVYQHQGKDYFEVYDHAQTTDKIFNHKGEVESYIFDYSKDPKSMIGVLQIYRLLGVV